MTAVAATMSGSQPNPSPSRLHEQPVLRVRVTGFPRRAAAAMCDMAILLAFTAAVTAAVALSLHIPIPSAREIGPDLLVAGILDRNPMAVGALGLLLGIAGLYQLYFAGIAGQTPGMRLLGIRIICRRGRPPGPARGLLRLLALIPSVGPAALGWLWAIFDREHRALHDHLAGTYVILEEE
ncbi:MAG: RDD family protein [Pseudomonadota bacterium]